MNGRSCPSTSGKEASRGVAVPGPELKDVAYLNTPARRQRRWADRAQVSIFRESYVGNQVRAEVSRIVDIAKVVVGPVGTDDKVGSHLNRVIRYGLHTLQAHRGGRASHQTRGGGLFGSGQAQIVCLKEVSQLDLVYLQIPPYGDEHRLTVCYVEYGLERLARGYPQQVRQLLYRLDAGRVDVLDGQRSFVGLGRLGERGPLRICRVVAAAADHDRVLAGVGQQHELGRVLAPDRSAIGGNHGGVEAASLVYPPICPHHRLVALVQALGVPCQSCRRPSCRTHVRGSGLP